MPFGCRPITILACWGQQQQGAVTAGQGFSGFIESPCCEGQSELIGHKFKTQGLNKRAKTLRRPAWADVDLVGAGKSIRS